MKIIDMDDAIINLFFFMTKPSELYKLLHGKKKLKENTSISWFLSNGDAIGIKCRTGNME